MEAGAAPKPHTQIQTRRGTLRFYLGDCLEVFRSLTPGTIPVIVTLPPYNLGVWYRSYDDTLPRDRYLDWTGAWIKAAANALDPAGSLFLNVGAKPTDPWTALDVAQALPGQHLVHPLPDDPEPRPGPPAPRDVPVARP